MGIDSSLFQGAELFYRLLGLVMFAGPVLGLWAYLRIRGPVRTNSSRMAGLMEEATGVLVPGLLIAGLLLMIMGAPGGEVTAGTSP